jgi:hypothetical protein
MLDLSLDGFLRAVLAVAEGSAGHDSALSNAGLLCSQLVELHAAVCMACSIVADLWLLCTAFMQSWLPFAWQCQSACHCKLAFAGLHGFFLWSTCAFPMPVCAALPMCTDWRLPKPGTPAADCVCNSVLPKCTSCLSSSDTRTDCKCTAWYHETAVRLSIPQVSIQCRCNLLASNDRLLLDAANHMVRTVVMRHLACHAISCTNLM